MLSDAYLFKQLALLLTHKNALKSDFPTFYRELSDRPTWSEYRSEYWIHGSPNSFLHKSTRSHTKLESDYRK